MIHEKLKQLFNGNVTYSKDMVIKKDKLVLDDSAVTDIKIVDTVASPSIAQSYRISGNKEYVLDGGYSVFITIVGPSKAANNWIEDIIVDISLFNYVWCSHSDLVVPVPTIDMVAKSRVSFGIDYCDHLAIWERTFYFDNWSRSFNINLDSDMKLSKYDFYDKSILNEIAYYTDNQNFIKVSPYTQNVLIAERYFSGLGCEFLPDPNDMVKSYSQLPILTNLAKATLAMSVCLVVLSYGFQFCYNKEKKNLMLVSAFLMAFFSLVSFTLLLAHLIISRASYDKIMAYQQNCKNNVNSVSFDYQVTSTMEIDYLYSIYYVRTLGGLTLLVQLGNLGALALFILTCKCWTTEDSEADVSNQNVEAREFDKVPDQKI